jgi:hypothetical protein
MLAIKFHMLTFFAVLVFVVDSCLNAGIENYHCPLSLHTIIHYANFLLFVIRSQQPSVFRWVLHWDGSAGYIFTDKTTTNAEL